MLRGSSKSTTSSRKSSKNSKNKSSKSKRSAITPTAASLEMFLDLPESIHTVVARFLKPEEALQMSATCARLALPQACQAWYGSDELYLVSRAKLPCSRLAALLRRLQGLKTLSARSVSIINPLAVVISLGLCKNICNLYLDRWGEPSPGQAADCLGAVIEAGFMPALQVLKITQEFKTGGVQALLSAFCKGASPNLHSLNVSLLENFEIEDLASDGEEVEYYEDDEQPEKNVEALSDMVEARKRLRSCIGLTELLDGWMQHGSVDARMRLLRSTLASLEALRFKQRELGDESCKELAGVLESEEVLAPKLAGLHFDRAFRNSRGATLVFQSIGANLTIFQNELELHIIPDYCLKTDS